MDIEVEFSYLNFEEVTHIEWMRLASDPGMMMQRFMSDDNHHI